MSRLHRIALAILVLFLAAPVSAQSPIPPVPPPIQPPEYDAEWSTLPDAVGYVQYFRVPQCNECDTQSWMGVPDTTPFPPLEGIFNPIFYLGEISRWVMSGISNLVRTLICTLLVILKLLADITVVVTNLILVAINFIYRIIILIWMLIKYLILFLAYLIQALMDVLMMVYVLIALLAYYIVMIIYMLLEALVIVFALLMTLLQLLSDFINVISFVFAFILSIFTQLFSGMGSDGGSIFGVGGAATNGLNIISVTAFSFMRGVVDAFLDSTINWLWHLVVGSTYFAFAMSIIRRFSRG
jgi:hypothetical protein